MKFFSWFRQWVRTVVAASSRKEFYRQIGTRKVGEALGHLALLALFLVTLPLLTTFFFNMRRGVPELTEGIRAHVPAGTVFEMKNGVLTSNVEVPLVFSDDEGLIMIDTATTTGTLPVAGEGATSTILVGSDGILQRGGGHGARFISFKDAPNFSISREDVLARISRWAPLALFLTAIFLGVFAFVGSWLAFLIMAAVHALAVWLALTIAKRAWPWKRAFVASAFAATLPIIASSVLTAIDRRLETVSNLLYWLILIWIVYDVITRNPAQEGRSEHEQPRTESVAGHAGEDRSDSV